MNNENNVPAETATDTANQQTEGTTLPASELPSEPSTEAPTADAPSAPVPDTGSETESRSPEPEEAAA